MNEPKWGRQEFESEAGFQAFCDYRSLKKPRRLKALLAKYMLLECAPTKKYATLRGWCARWYWKERSIAWDGYEQRVIAERLIDAKAEDALKEQRIYSESIKGLSRGIIANLVGLNNLVKDFRINGQLPEHMRTVGDLESLARITRMLSMAMGNPAEAWAEAIGIAGLLDSVEIEESEE